MNLYIMIDWHILVLLFGQNRNSFKKLPGLKQIELFGRNRLLYQAHWSKYDTLLNIQKSGLKYYPYFQKKIENICLKEYCSFINCSSYSIPLSAKLVCATFSGLWLFFQFHENGCSPLSTNGRVRILRMEGAFDQRLVVLHE